MIGHGHRILLHELVVPRQITFISIAHVTWPRDAVELVWIDYELRSARRLASRAHGISIYFAAPAAATTFCTVLHCRVVATT